jgi:4-amino-4-deoxychorismate lyase
MAELVESIMLRDGVPLALDRHEARARRARAEIFGVQVPFTLAPLIGEVPEEFRAGAVKCRLHYGPDFLFREFELYKKKPYGRLALVDGGSIEYAHKYADRSALNRLLALRGDCDNIVIVKDGHLSDAHSANILLFDGSTFLTPARPLLQGTKRAKLVADGFCREADIKPSDLEDFKELHIVNAFLDPGEEVVPIDRIVDRR